MRLHKSGEDYLEAILTYVGLTVLKEKKYPAIMLAGSVLCAVFAGLCWKGYKKQ